MTQNDRAKGTMIVNILSAINIINHGTISSFEYYWGGKGAHVGVDAAGNNAFNFLEEGE